jgi:hypothetical protein
MCFPNFSNFLSRNLGFNFHSEKEFTMTTTRMESPFGFSECLTMLLVALLTAASSINCIIWMSNNCVLQHFSCRRSSARPIQPSKMVSKAEKVPCVWFLPYKYPYMVFILVNSLPECSLAGNITSGPSDVIREPFSPSQAWEEVSMSFN